MDSKFSPAEKIQRVEQQIQACEKGQQEYIDCPYCGERNHRGELLCCMTFAKACRAILERHTSQELAEAAERIAEALDRR